MVVGVGSNNKRPSPVFNIHLIQIFGFPLLQYIDCGFIQGGFLLYFFSCTASEFLLLSVVIKDG